MMTAGKALGNPLELISRPLSMAMAVIVLIIITWCTPLVSRV